MRIASTTETGYPKTLWMGTKTRTANSKRDEEQFMLEGWAPQYTHQDYPKMLYFEGQTSGVKVFSQAEEEKVLAATKIKRVNTPFVPGEAAAIAAAASPDEKLVAENERLQDLADSQNDQIQQLNTSVEDLKKQFAALQETKKK